MIMGVIQFSCHVPWRPLSSVWQAFISNGKRSVIWEPICSGLCVHLTSEWYAVEPSLFPSILLGFSSPFNVRRRSITYITLLNITSCKMIGKNLAASIDSIVLFFSMLIVTSMAQGSVWSHCEACLISQPSTLSLKCLLHPYLFLSVCFFFLEYYSCFKSSQECHDSVDLIIPNMVETLKITNAGITENDFLTNNITIPDVNQRHSICLCAHRGTSLYKMCCVFLFKAWTLRTNMHKYNRLFYSESMNVTNFSSQDQERKINWI